MDTKRVQQFGDCWIWRSSPDSYGQVKVAGKMMYAHRLSFYLFNGDIPADREILHSCDTPSCINPAHLRVGTRRENLHDMVARGRSNFGEKNWNAKLSEDQAREIKRRALSGEKQTLIAKEFGISNRQVSDIKLGKRWKHI